MTVSGRNLAAGVVWAIIAVCIWSGSLVLLRLGVTTSLNAYDLAALRFGTAALLIAGVVWRRGWALSQLGVSGIVALIICQGAPYILVLSTGLQFAPASDAGAVNPGLMAVFVGVLGWIFLGERMSRAKIIGIMAILAGTVMFSDLLQVRVASRGHLIFAITGGMWACYTIIVRRAGIKALHATAIVAVGSAVFYLPIYAAFLPSRLFQAPLADVLIQAVYQGALTSVVALFAFTSSAAYLGASAGAALIALIPIVTLAMGAAFLGEAAGGRQLGAACLIGLGVALTLLSRRSGAQNASKTP